MTAVASALNIADLREAARRRLPRMIFDYIDGGSGAELALRENVGRLAEYRIVPDTLIDVSNVDTRTRVLGADLAVPFFPTAAAAQRLYHYDGELAGARAAEKLDTAFTLSTVGSVSIEDCAKATSGPKWFQVYVWKDHAIVDDMLDRARAAGFSAVILTVDVPVVGIRERDLRNGFSLPPRINWQTLRQLISRPGWLYDVLTHEAIGIPNFANRGLDRNRLAGFVSSQYDSGVTWKDAERIRQRWNGPFAIKGILNPDDARRCVDLDSAVWVSNHGGRQLESARATIDALPAIVKAVAGAVDVIFDGGVRRGGDIVKAMALGASAVAIGRAYLYGLAAGGQSGVERAFGILQAELENTLRLTGCPSSSDLVARFVHPPRGS